jgi:hypothetical protein
MNTTACADLIDQQLAQAGEGSTVDYKASMSWPSKGTGERARLVRHIIGFSNARDGGYLLIGVDDVTKKATGLTPEDASSWNPTHITEAVSQFGAPPPLGFRGISERFVSDTTEKFLAGRR